jgi:hypothetical protein
MPFALSLSKGARARTHRQGFDKLSPNGKQRFARGLSKGRPSLMPFALSLSKDARARTHRQGFDKLSPNGKQRFALSLSEGRPSLILFACRREGLRAYRSG